MSDLKIPVLLIHGFHGEPDDWSQAEGLRDALIAAGLDPTLVRLFSYGYTGAAGEPPRYNDAGDIREIASRLSWRDTDEAEALDGQVDRLSEASVAAGGPAGVTIVAHSMGGLVARYYLSRESPDEFGTFYGGKVSRLILLGTPNLGLDPLELVALIPPDAFLWKVVGWFERLPFFKGRPRQALAAIQSEVAAMQARAREEALPIATRGLAESVALRQMAPGSAFMRALNAKPLPPGVALSLLYGDVRFGVHLRWGRLLLWSHVLSFGDLLVPAQSARSVPHMSATTHAFAWGREWTIQLGQEEEAGLRGLSELLPPVAHSRLLVNPEVHQTILTILTAQ